MSRDWRLYVDEMIDAAERSRRFSDTVVREDFIPGAMAFEAAVRQIEIFGEAAHHVPQSIRDELPDVPWRDIVDMRNRLIHGYFAVDPDIVWSVVYEKLPQLLPALKAWRSRA